MWTRTVQFFFHVIFWPILTKIAVCRGNFMKIPDAELREDRFPFQPRSLVVKQTQLRRHFIGLFSCLYFKIVNSTQNTLSMWTRSVQFFFSCHFLADFNQNRSVSRKFRENPRCGISREDRFPVGAQLLHSADGQSWRTVIVASRARLRIVAESALYLHHVRPSVGVQQRGFHWTDICQIWYLWTSIDANKIKICLQPGKNLALFAWNAVRPLG